jgi:hypothetical protein
MRRAQEGILLIAHYLALNKLTLRELFMEQLYDEKVSDKEFELLAIRSFSDISKTYLKLEEKHVQAISILMSDHFIGESFDFTFFEEIFR